MDQPKVAERADKSVATSGDKLVARTASKLVSKKVVSSADELVGWRDNLWVVWWVALLDDLMEN